MFELYKYAVLYESTVQEEMLTETGSTKDAEISGHGVSDERTENPHCSEHSGILLGDSGYTCKRFLMTPNLNPQKTLINDLTQPHVERGCTCSLRKVLASYNGGFPLFKEF